MMSLLGHIATFGRNCGQWEYHASRDRWIEIGEGLEQPFMRVTNSDHVVDEKHVAVCNVVQEANEQLDYQGINTVVNDKFSQCSNSSES